MGGLREDLMRHVFHLVGGRGKKESFKKKQEIKYKKRQITRDFKSLLDKLQVFYLISA